MFKKPKRNFRQRIRLSDDEDGKASEEKYADPVQEVTVLPDKEEQSQDEDLTILSESKSLVRDTKAKLSFHDDEGDVDVFKVKKSSRSRRILKQLEKQKKQSEENVSKPKQEDNFEKLKQEQETGISVRKLMEKKKESEKKELEVVWVKSEEVKQARTAPSAIEIPAEDPFSDDSGDESETEHIFRRGFQRGAIPDAKTIYELKKQRQSARDNDEIIPISTNNKEEFTTNYGLSDSKVEEDDDDEDDEDGRIDFQVEQQTDFQKSRDEFQSQVEIVDLDNEDSDDEMERWEREQIRKGLGAQSSNLPSSSRTFNPLLDDNQLESAATQIPEHVSRSKKKVDFDTIIHKLESDLNERKENVNRHQRRLVEIGIETMQSEEEISEMEHQLKHVSKEFEVYQTVANYITSKLLPRT
ncbi:hypothetical protein HDE_00820 [Halotydeus destructor]|nr:hypothetical protein HDE_00820 [Halotydeus destructor]